MQSDSTLNPEYDHHSKLSSRLGAVAYEIMYHGLIHVPCKGNLNSEHSEVKWSSRLSVVRVSE